LRMPVVTDPKKAAQALRFCVKEMERRYQMLGRHGARNIEGYNRLALDASQTEEPKLPYLVVVVDELADLMALLPTEIEEPIQRLAQMARAVGIHLILATQRPSVDVLTGMIKANFPSRIAFQVASRTDSRVILDMNGAESLLGHGDCLYLPAGKPEPYRIHRAFISGEGVERVIGPVRLAGGERGNGVSRGPADLPQQTESHGPTARVALVTLGCAKNLVDSEIMAGLLAKGTFTMTSDPAAADVALVNTCAFIGPSQRESIDRILEMAALKREGKLRGIVVAGCLAQRYQADLLNEIPEVDAVVGTGQVDAIVRVMNRVLRSPSSRILEVGPPGTAVDLASHRAVSPPRHVAYLRIADGCDFRCTFCIIPALRGDLRSRPLESVVAEARRLAEGGTRELLLIAQDSTSYGADLYGEARLPDPL